MDELRRDECDTAMARAEGAHDETGRNVVRLTGELDLSNVPSIEATIDTLLGAEPTLRLDLRDLSFMDSSAIAMLLRYANRTERVELWNASTLVTRLLGATGLLEVFELHHA